MIRRKKKALEAFEKSEINTGYQEVDAQITSIDDKIAEATKKANALEREFEKVAASLEAREKEFWASGGDLSRSRDAIKLEMRKISAEVEQIRSDILRLAVDASTPLFMCRKLVVQSYNAAATLPTSESLRYTSEKISDYHRRIMEGLDTLGLSKADLLSVKTLISSILNAQLPQSAEPRQSQRMSATTIMLYKRLISEVFQSITQKIDQLIVQEETQENQRMSLDAHLGTADEKTLAMQLFDALKSLEADKAIAEAERKRQSDMIESLHRQRDVLVAKRVQLMKAIAEKEHANDDNARIVKYAAMSIVALNEFKVRLQREKIAQLSQTATQCFRSLVEKDSLIRAIKVDTDNLDVTIWGSDGKEVLKTQLSAGEQQMFAVSIIWALALTSGYKAPVVIDTPMARLDSSNRANFVTKYLPAASSQVVVLSTDEEINGRYLDMIRGNVADYYTLLYNEDAQCTSIVSGYFREEDTQ